MMDRALGLFFLVVGVAYAASAFQIKAGFTSDTLGPRAYPLLLAAVLVGLSLVKVVRPRQGTALAMPDRASLIGIGLAVTSFVFYALLLEPVGFLVSTAVEVAFLCAVYGATWRQALLTGVITSGLLYGLFDLLLDLHLPAGTLLS